MSKLWAEGRFEKPLDRLAEQFSKSIHYDYKLAKYDVLGSIAHVYILKGCGHLQKDEASALLKALDKLYGDIESNEYKFDPNSEDIHSDIQAKVEKLVGSDIVLKLHTARSRNDQVSFATRLYCKNELRVLSDKLHDLRKTLLDLCKENSSLIIPGFTHLQHAQPVLLFDYLTAYTEMFSRDFKRLAELSINIKVPLGAGALAGSPLSYTYNQIAGKQINESKKLFVDLNITPVVNSIDTVSDRDFIIEILSALSIAAMHFSRLSEDLIIWSTKEFNFVEIDDSYCTSSSLMPQKKNPDILELIRGCTGRIYGNLISVLTMMKGLPLSYNRDMQLDKEPLFDSIETINSVTTILTGLMKTLRFNKKEIQEHLKDEALYATDLVYYLIDKDIPFKTAHSIIGELVQFSIKNKIPIKEMSQSKLNQFSDKLLKKEIPSIFNPYTSIISKHSIFSNEDRQAVMNILKKKAK